MTNFEIFKMREKDIPVDTLEMGDRIVAFAWEPKGKRMCIIHGEGSRPDVSFYTVNRYFVCSACLSVVVFFVFDHFVYMIL